MSPSYSDSSSPDETTIQQLKREIAGLHAELDYRQRAESRVSGILAAALDAVISMDHRGRIVDWNPAAEEMFGYSHVEAVGQDLAELIIPERLRDEHRRGLRRCLETGEGPVLGKRVEMPAVDRDGTEFPVELGITKIVDDPPLLFTGHIRNVSQMRQLLFEQQFLGEATKVLSTSLDYQTTLDQVAQIPVPELATWCIVYLADDNGGQPVRKAVAYDDPDLQHIGQVMLHTAQLDPEARVGVPYVVRTGNSVLYSDVTPEVFTSDIEHPEELLHLMRELQLKSWMCVPLLARGRIIGAMSFISMEGGRRYTERDVRIAEDLAHRAALIIDNVRLYDQAQHAIQARDDFLSVASHELKTPLTVLKGYTQLLRSHLTKPEPSHHRAEGLMTHLESQLERIEVLVNDLLDMSRIQRGRLQLHPQETDTAALARSVIGRFEDTVSRSERHNFSLDVPDHPVTGLLDPSRLDHVLTSLLSNAVRYSPEGGQIRMSVKQVDDEVAIDVQDDGNGIPESDQAEIFEPFPEVANGSGSIGRFGLGLYICREIVQQHGGRISLESHVGEGSTFRVRLPLRYVAG